LLANAQSDATFSSLLVAAAPPPLAPTATIHEQLGPAMLIKIWHLPLLMMISMQQRMKNMHGYLPPQDKYSMPR
jgi:hypothetical protein